jgi:hypothetical protein
MSSLNKPTSAADLAEYEALSGLTTSAFKSSEPSRWERKKNEKANQTLSQRGNNLSAANLGSASKRARDTLGPSCNDRFIPNRAAMDMANASASMLSNENPNDDVEIGSHADKLKKALFGDSASSNSSRILSLRESAPLPEVNTVLQNRQAHMSTIMFWTRILL